MQFWLQRIHFMSQLFLILQHFHPQAMLLILSLDVLRWSNEPSLVCFLLAYHRTPIPLLIHYLSPTNRTVCFVERIVANGKYFVGQWKRTSHVGDWPSVFYSSSWLLSENHKKISQLVPQHADEYPTDEAVWKQAPELLAGNNNIVSYHPLNFLQTFIASLAGVFSLPAFDDPDTYKILCKEVIGIFVQFHSALGDKLSPATWYTFLFSFSFDHFFGRYTSNFLIILSFL